MHPRRRTLITLVSPLALAACAGLMGPPTVTLSQTELQSLVERNFPIERPLLDLFNVTVDAPRLRLLPERNRIAAVVALRARDRVFARQWQAQFSFDAALRWEPRDQTVRLTQVRVQDLALDKPDSAPRSTVDRLGAALAERVMEESTIYRLPPERQEQMRRLGVSPGAVTVTARGVEITFAPSAP